MIHYRQGIGEPFYKRSPKNRLTFGEDRDRAKEDKAKEKRIQCERTVYDIK